jgi:hypothetical protein
MYEDVVRSAPSGDSGGVSRVFTTPGTGLLTKMARALFIRPEALKGLNEALKASVVHSFAAFQQSYQQSMS